MNSFCQISADHSLLTLIIHGGQIMIFLKREGELPWQPHPFLPIQIKPFLTQKDDQSPLTCFLVKIPVGDEIPIHIHEIQEDIIFILAGQARMWIEGVGEFPISKGSLIRVPKNTRHRIFDVQEEILNFDVFVPPLF